ncbi:MAG: regulatory protein NosR [Oceanospirillaceae bacterium]|nr:regulatory protein NosR [Oceanospirillaceae bacterium]MCP5350271.1 regulatory protein NosR [Oceanospirillaceae bacterium]
MFYKNIILFLLTFFSLSAAANNAETQTWLADIVSGADKFQVEENIVIARQGDKRIAYGFESNDIVHVPAYSGKPINIRIALDADGKIIAAKVIEHHEPILLVGIPEQKLQDFVGAYVGHLVTDSIQVGTGEGADVDAITGATVTVIVTSETIMSAVRQVAKRFSLAGLTPAEDVQARIDETRFEKLSWQQLLDKNLLGHLYLQNKTVDAAFGNNQQIYLADDEQQDPEADLIDMYFAPLNIPNVGRNLLGDAEYQWLMQEIKPGDIAIAVMADGEYSFRGNGYVRGGIFDRIQLHQNNHSSVFRDMDYIRLNDVYVDGFPGFGEMAIFISRAANNLNLGQPWQMELMVRRQTGPIASEFKSFFADYAVPSDLLIMPEPQQAVPLWKKVWADNTFKVAVVGVALLFLLVIIFAQDWLVKKGRSYQLIRRIYLLFTIFFLGWYCLGQLSVVNVFTFVHALFSGFSWELFLLDPVIFVLWGFVALTLLLWGRGIFCGWLCPFGAMQELINEAARHLKIKQIELPFWLHERLWAIKYIILLGLFAISLDSLATAEQFAEVEPFKTAVMLKFDRQWWFVLYAVFLLVISIFTRKAYCRYICPLGAALTVPGRFQVFNWLHRRKECGQPCQLCAVECEIKAIHPDGRINTNECHYCLDCQVTYQSDKKCPPLINKAKKQRKAVAQEIPIQNL